MSIWRTNNNQDEREKEKRSDAIERPGTENTLHLALVLHLSSRDAIQQRRERRQFYLHHLFLGFWCGEEGRRFVGLYLKLNSTDRKNIDEQRTGVLEILRSTGERAIPYIAVLAETPDENRAEDLMIGFRDLARDVTRQRGGPVGAVLGRAVLL